MLLKFLQIGVSDEISSEVHNIDISCAIGLQVFSEDDEGLCVFFSVFLTYCMFQFFYFDTDKLTLNEFMPYVTSYFTTYHNPKYTYNFIINFAWWLMTTVINKNVPETVKTLIVDKTIDELIELEKKDPSSFSSKDVFVSLKELRMNQNRMQISASRLESINYNAEVPYDNSYLLATSLFDKKQQEEKRNIKLEQMKRDEKHKNDTRFKKLMRTLGTYKDEPFRKRKLGESCKRSHECHSNLCHPSAHVCVYKGFRWTSAAADKLNEKNRIVRQENIKAVRESKYSDPHDLSYK
jgi:hypothetical protein